MRRPRIKADGQAVYHCISKSVDGRVIFPYADEASVEGETFVEFMRKLEQFCGIRVITFVLMATHYHIVCEVPQPVEISDPELLNRIEKLYGRTRREAPR